MMTKTTTQAASVQGGRRSYAVDVIHQSHQGRGEGVMIINNKETKAKGFAYDNCHKIYLLERESDWADASQAGYTILPIEMLPEAFDGSCELRFISNWALTKQFVRQFEPANFDEVTQRRNQI